jgi:hypothetical protein
MLIHNAEVTGSLNINNVPFNSGSFSGSFRGDGSQLTGVTGASTASYVEYSNVGNKPALVSSSSQITYSGLSGIPSGIVSGSSQVTYSGLTGIPAGIVSGSAQITGFGIFATTGSNQFNGSQAVTGSLTVTGQVVAQTLNVQQVTSSIVFSSGSNIFGNDLGNTQQFTGSVSVTGSLTVNGVNYLPLTGGTLTGPLNGTSATFGGDLTLQGSVTRNIRFLDNTNTNLNAQIQYDQIDSNSGQLLFGTNNAGTFATRLTLSNTGAATFSVNTNASLLITNSGQTPILSFRSNGVTAAGRIRVDEAFGGGEMVFSTKTTGGVDTDRMAITALGNIGIGTTNPNAFVTASGFGNLVVGDGSGETGITIYSGTTGSSGLMFADATSGPAAYTGYIVYRHTTDTMEIATGGGTPRLTITSTGAATFSSIVNVGFDSNNRSTVRLTSNAANRQAAIYFYGNNVESSVIGYEGGSEIVGEGVQGDFVIRNVLANKNIILTTNAGNVGIGLNNPDATLTVKSSNVGGYGSGTPDFAINGNIGSNATALQIYRTAATGGNIVIDCFRAGVGAANLIINAPNGGNVLIGTTSNIASSKLRVSGNLQIDGFQKMYTYYIVVGPSSTGTITISSPTGTNMQGSMQVMAGGYGNGITGNVTGLWMVGGLLFFNNASTSTITQIVNSVTSDGSMSFQRSSDQYTVSLTNTAPNPTGTKSLYVSVIINGD